MLSIHKEYTAPFYFFAILICCYEVTGNIVKARSGTLAGFCSPLFQKVAVSVSEA